MAKMNPTNEDRAAWAYTALMAFMRVSGTRYEDSLGDLLTDLMHWADGNNFDFHAALNRASVHHAEEQPGLAAKRRRAIVQLAHDQHAREGELEIDEGATISEGDDNGAYVQAWVWLDFSGTPFDKGP